MSANDVQGRLLGGPTGESATIETSGRVIRPAVGLPAALVDELKLHLREDSVYLRAIDPANVGLCELTVHDAAFADYYLDADDEVLVGCQLDPLQSKLRNARMGKRTDDPVEIDVDETRTVLEIEREYSETTVRYADEVLNIDPDSIRQEPNPPDLELPASAEIDVDAFKDAIEHIDRSSNHVDLIADGDDLLLTCDSSDDSPGEYGAAVEFTDVVTTNDGDRPVSTFGLDYLKDMAAALKKAKVDGLTVELGEEFPVQIHFERSIDDAIAYEGRYFLAPRLSQGDSA